MTVLAQWGALRYAFSIRLPLVALRRYRFHVICGIQTDSTVLTSLAPTLLVFVFKLFENFTWNFCGVNDVKFLSITTQESPTHLERQLIAFGTFVIVKSLNRDTGFAIIHQNVISRIAFIPFLFLVERVLGIVCLSVGTIPRIYRAFIKFKPSGSGWTYVTTAVPPPPPPPVLRDGEVRGGVVAASLFFNEALSDLGDSWLGVVARCELLLLLALLFELLILSVADVRFMLFLLLLLAGGGYSYWWKNRRRAAMAILKEEGVIRKHVTGLGKIESAS